MGKGQRIKGKNGELEIVNILKDNGIVSKRISMMEANAVDKGDITVNDKIGSVKRGDHAPKFLYKALGDADYLFCRRDREEWLVTMDIATFILLLRKSLLDTNI